MESARVCSISTGELLGPPITGAIYDATNSWHCVIAFSGTVQVVAAIALLYGVLSPLCFAKSRLTIARRPAQRGSRENPRFLRFTEARKATFRSLVILIVKSYT